VILTDNGNDDLFIKQISKSYLIATGSDLKNLKKLPFSLTPAQF
jgi:hypothetical protein